MATVTPPEQVQEYSVPYPEPFSSAPYTEPFSPIKESHTTTVITIEDIIQDEHHFLETVALSSLDEGVSVEIDEDPESGYMSDGSSVSSPEPQQQVTLTDLHLNHLNQEFERLAPYDILRICKLIFPGLYQTTAFGLTGLATLDMLSKLHAETPGSSPVDVIFLDTLYHFQETLDLAARIQERYPEINLHTFRPEGCATAAEFEARHGSKLWESDAERYDYVAKVEPQPRSYDSLNVAAVLTGRRRSQGAARGSIPVVELDRERGIVKINPFVSWSFEQVNEYIKTNNVPYNELLDRGYKSVGDWHSTQPVAAGEDERAGRWKGQQKTECGIHNTKSRYAMFLMEQAKKQAALDAHPTVPEPLFDTPMLPESGTKIGFASGPITAWSC